MSGVCVKVWLISPQVAVMISEGHAELVPLFAGPGQVGLASSWTLQLSHERAGPCTWER